MHNITQVQHSITYRATYYVHTYIHTTTFIIPHYSTTRTTTLIKPHCTTHTPPRMSYRSHADTRAHTTFHSSMLTLRASHSLMSSTTADRIALQELAVAEAEIVLRVLRAKKQLARAKVDASRKHDSHQLRAHCHDTSYQPQLATFHLLSHD